MTDKTFQDKNIVISAAADGIGWSIVKKCLDKGAKVFLCDNNQESLDKVCSHPLFDKYLFSYFANASKEKDVINFFQKVNNKFNSLDVLINNVGIAGPTGPIETLSSKEWEETLQVNLNSHFYFIRESIPLIKKSGGGSIINLSSTAGIFGFPFRSPYAASKWAVVGLTKTLAMELGNYNIRVNAICPGSVSGDRMDNVIKAMAELTNKDEKVVRRNLESMTSIKGFVSKEDIANMCIFLITEEAKKISGQVFPIDGNTERMS